MSHYITNGAHWGVYLAELKSYMLKLVPCYTRFYIYATFVLKCQRAHAPLSRCLIMPRRYHVNYNYSDESRDACHDYGRRHHYCLFLPQILLPLI